MNQPKPEPALPQPGVKLGFCSPQGISPGLDERISRRAAGSLDPLEEVGRSRVGPTPLVPTQPATWDLPAGASVYRCRLSIRKQQDLCSLIQMGTYYEARLLDASGAVLRTSSGGEAKVWDNTEGFGFEASDSGFDWIVGETGPGIPAKLEVRTQYDPSILSFEAVALRRRGAATPRGSAASTLAAGPAVQAR